MKTNHTQFYWPCMVQETRRKKWLPFELICAVEIVTLNRYPVVTRYILWTDLICSVHQEPSRQKVASIWTYMCSILRRHSNHSLCLSIPKFTDLICSVNKTLAVKKWLPLELICAVYLEYIVTIILVCPYPNLLTLYVQYTKTLAVKKWLPLELRCAVDLEYIVTIHFASPCPN